MKNKPIRQPAKLGKRMLIKVVLVLVGRALKACYKLDSRVKAEVDSMPKNYKIRMGVKPFKLKLDFEIMGDNIRIAKEADFIPALNITFKSAESAIYALTGMKSVAACYAEQRFAMNGDIMLGGTFIRIMNIIEAYLFPKFITRILFNRQAPIRERTMARIYIGTLFGI